MKDCEILVDSAWTHTNTRICGSVADVVVDGTAMCLEHAQNHLDGISRRLAFKQAAQQNAASDAETAPRA